MESSSIDVDPFSNIGEVVSMDNISKSDEISACTDIPDNNQPEIAQVKKHFDDYNEIHKSLPYFYNFFVYILPLHDYHFIMFILKSMVFLAI